MQKEAKYLIWVASAFILLSSWYVTKDITHAPKIAVEQFTLAPDNPFQRLGLNQSIHQDFVMQRPWAEIAVRYLPSTTTTEKEFTFSIQQNGQDVYSTTESRRVVKSSPDGTDFFTNDHWLFFKIPQLPAQQSFSFHISAQEGRERVPTGNFVGLVKTSLLDRLNWTLTHNRNVLHVDVALIIILIGVLIWQFINISKPAAKPRIAILLLVIFTLCFTLPLFKTSDLWGKSDWTEVAAHFKAAEHAFSVGQLPLWNPYFCGGFPAWSNPQTYWPSLIFLISSIAGDVTGTKLAIIAYFFIGLTGMYMVARALKLTPFVATLSAVIFLGNGFMAAHIGVGHLLWLTAAYVPWVIFFFIKSLKSPWFLVASAASALAIFIEGQVYFTLYTFLFLIFFSVGWYMHTRQTVILKHLGFFFLLVLGLGAIKLIPTLIFVHTIQGNFGTASFIPANLWYDVFLRSAITNPAIGDEQYAYIGLLPFCLFVIGTVLAFKKRHWMYVGIAISTVLFLLLSFIPQANNPLLHLPLTSYLRTPTRALLIVMFGIALLSAFGWNAILQKMQNVKLRQTLALICFFVVAASYILASRPFLNNLFSLPPNGIPSATEFRQTAGQSDTTYHITKAGLGNVSSCPPHLTIWQQKGAVATEGTPSYKGEVYAEQGTTVQLSNFTPNELTISIGEVRSEDTVHINQNYDAGWHSKDLSVFSRNGHIAFTVTSKNTNQTVILSYIPKGFIFGSTITLGTIIALISLAIFKRYNPYKSS